MKVVLLANVPNLGKIGEVKEVSDGYARNFLVPRKLATLATDAALKQVEVKKQAEARREAKAAEQLQTLAKRIEGTEVVFKVRMGDQGRLYGSITASDVADALSKKIGEPVDKRRIDLDEPIKQAGRFEVPLRLGKGLAPKIYAVVEGS